MGFNLEEKEKHFLKKHTLHNRYIFVLISISFLVALVVTVSLIRKAESMAYICGCEEHIHNESCYELICEKHIDINEETGEEKDHVHALYKGCYDTDNVLCGMEQHVHGYECVAHDEEDSALDVLTAEEISEMESSAEAEGGTIVTDADTADIASDDILPDNTAENDDGLLEDGYYDEPVTTEAPSDSEHVSSVTVTTSPKDEEVMLVTGLTAEHKVTPAVTVADVETNVVEGVTQRPEPQYSYKVNIREVYENKNDLGKEVRRKIILENPTSVNMFGAGTDQPSYDLSGDVAAAYAGCNCGNIGDMFVRDTSDANAKAKMWLEIEFAGKWMVNTEHEDQMSREGKCRLPVSIVTVGPSGEVTEPASDYYYWDAKLFNKNGKPVYVVPLDPLPANQRYEIRNDMTIDPRRFDSSSYGWNELPVGARITLKYFNALSFKNIGTLTSNRNPNWEVSTGFSFDKKIVMDEDLGGHNYGMMKWEVHLRNPNRFDLTGMTVYCAQFSSADEMLVADLTPGRNVQLSKTAHAYNLTDHQQDTNGYYHIVEGVNPGEGGEGREFTFKSDPNSSDPYERVKDGADYCFVFAIPYRIWVGTYTPYANLKTENIVWSNMYKKYVKVAFAGDYWQSLRFSIPAFMHAKVSESNYDESTHIADTTFEFDFGFPHQYDTNDPDLTLGLSESCIGKTFTCDLKSLTDSDNAYKDNITIPNLNAIRITSYREYVLGGADVTGNGSYTLDYNDEKKTLSITFNSIPERDNSPGRQNYYTAEIKVSIPVKIVANSIYPGNAAISKIQATGGYDNQHYDNGTNIAVVTIGNSFRIFDNFRHGYNQNDTTHALSLVKAPTDTPGGQGGFLTWSIEAGATGKYYIAKIKKEGPHADKAVTITAEFPPGVTFNVNNLIFKVHDELIKENVGNGEYRYKYDEAHWTEYKYDTEQHRSEAFDHGLIAVTPVPDNPLIYNFTIDISKDKYLAAGKQFRITIPTNLTLDEYGCLPDDLGIPVENTIYKTYTLTAHDDFDPEVRRPQKQRIPTTLYEAMIVANGRHLKYTPGGYAVLEYTFNIKFTAPMTNKILYFDLGDGHHVTPVQRDAIKIYYGNSSTPLEYSGENKRYNKPEHVKGNEKHVKIELAFPDSEAGDNNTKQELTVVVCTTTYAWNPEAGREYQIDGKIYHGNQQMAVGDTSATLIESEFIRLWDGLDETTLGKDGIGLDQAGINPPGRFEVNPTIHEWAYLPEASEGKSLTWMIQGHPVTSLLGYPDNETADQPIYIDVTLPAGLQWSDDLCLYTINGSSNGAGSDWKLYEHLTIQNDWCEASSLNVNTRRIKIKGEHGNYIRANHTRFVIVFKTAVQEPGTYTVSAVTYPNGTSFPFSPIKQTQRVYRADITGWGKVVSVSDVNEDNIRCNAILEYSIDLDFHGAPKNKRFEFDLISQYDENSHKVEYWQAPADAKGDVLVYRKVNGSWQCLSLGDTGTGFYIQSRRDRTGNCNSLIIDSRFADDKEGDETFRVIFRTTAYRNRNNPGDPWETNFDVTARLYDGQEDGSAQLANKTIELQINKILLMRVWDGNDKEHINEEPDNPVGGLGKDSGPTVNCLAETTHKWLDLPQYKDDPNMRELTWIVQGNPVTWMTGFARDRDIEIRITKSLLTSDIVKKGSANNETWSAMDVKWSTDDMKLYTIGDWNDGSWVTTPGEIEANLQPVPDGTLSFRNNSTNVEDLIISKDSDIVRKQLKFVIVVKVGIPNTMVNTKYALTAHTEYVHVNNSILQYQTITQLPGPVLPATGGTGTKKYVIIGSAMITCSAVLGLLKKRRKSIK